MKKLIIYLLLSSLSLSCVTLRKCEQKFGRGQVTDTTYTTVPITVPRDSAVLVTKTQMHFDTTHTRIVEVSKQGRATVTIIREPVNTTVLANCDSVVIEKKVPVAVTTRQFGVSPWWKWGALASGGLLLLAAGSVLFLSRYQVSRRPVRRRLT